MKPVKVASLWKNKTSEGKTFLKGKISSSSLLEDLPEKIPVTILPNTHKADEDQHDYNLFLYLPEEEECVKPKSVVKQALSLMDEDDL